MTGRVSALAFVALVALMACASHVPDPSPPPGASLPDPASLHACEETFRVWVEGSPALNDPGVDMVGQMGALELIQKRVFELCPLAEAERLNHQFPLEVGPGVTKALIEPDFKTFAEVECVDESPLLDGTPLCAEVAR
jgi:hypothetical protein